MQILNQLPIGSFDLHIHTTFSDGIYTPTEIVQLAKNKGLKTISITDHDTVAGIDEAIQAGKKHHINIIPGVEITTFFEKRSVDILGYNIKDLAQLQDQLSTYRDARVDRAKLIIERFCQLGMFITLEDVLQFSKGGVIARPHIAQAIVKRGYVPSVQEVFDQYLADGKPASVSKKRLTISEGVELIHSVGGAAILAHPVYLEGKQMILEILQNGLDGIEVWHRKHKRSDVDLFQHIASTLDLIITGGSDFHNNEHTLGKFMP